MDRRDGMTDTQRTAFDAFMRWQAGEKVDFAALGPAAVTEMRQSVGQALQRLTQLYAFLSGLESLQERDGDVALPPKGSER